MAKWIVRGCFGFTWIYSLGCWVIADRPAEFLAAAIAFVVVPMVFLPLCEELED